jgi:hypothetical protein
MPVPAATQAPASARVGGFAERTSAPPSVIRPVTKVSMSAWPAG